MSKKGLLGMNVLYDTKFGEIYGFDSGSGPGVGVVVPTRAPIGKHEVALA